MSLPLIETKPPKNWKKVSIFILAITIAVSTTYVCSSKYNIGYEIRYIVKYNKTPISTVMNASGFILPHQHVYYLKTHKTGSTTMHNILAEYSRSHDLIPLLPSHGEHINQAGAFNPSQAKILSGIKKYDMVFSHHIYSPSILNYLHSDSFKVTSIREPFSNFVSAFLYYRNRWNVSYLKKIPTNDPVTEFLRNPKKYEVSGYGTWTNNRMSLDMGYPVTKRFDDISFIKQFIEMTDKRFDLVIPMEYFDEGLVLMKRTLRWSTEDIIYYSVNAGKYYQKDTKNVTALDTERRKLHAKFSQADIMLYDHFLTRFKKKMDKAESLEQETTEFRNILAKFRDYCDSAASSNENLVIPAGRWNNGFQLTHFKCKMLKIGFHTIMSYLQTRQKHIVSL